MAELDRFGFVPGLEEIQIEVDMLDFDYVANCNDWKTVLKILQILSSGKEGHFPALTQETEKRLLEIMPSKEKKKYMAITMKPTRTDEVDAEADLRSWLEESSKREKEYERLMKQSGELSSSPDSPSSSPNYPLSSTPLPYEKFFNKVQIEKVKDAYKNMKGDSLNQLMKEKISDNERQKGNEYFKVQEYEKAITHYTNSLALTPMNEVIYTNRALAYIKLSSFQNSLMDCNVSISLKKNFLKAYLRRGLTYFSLGRYREAAIDFNYVLLTDKTNKECLKLLEKTYEKYKDVEGKELIIENSVFKKEVSAASNSPTNSTIEKIEVKIEKMSSFDSLLFSLKDYKEINKGQLEKLDIFERIILDNKVEEKKEEKFVRVQIVDDSDDDEEDNEKEEKKDNFVRINIESDDEDDDEDNEKEEEEKKRKENLELSNKYKELGNEKMKLKDFTNALEDYNISLQYNTLNFSTYSNRSLLYLCLKQYNDSISDSSIIINDFLKNNTRNGNTMVLYKKALYRRSESYYQLSLLDTSNMQDFIGNSLNDIRVLIELSPEDAGAIKLREKIMSRIVDLTSIPAPPGISLIPSSPAISAATGTSSPSKSSVPSAAPVAPSSPTSNTSTDVSPPAAPTPVPTKVREIKVNIKLPENPPKTTIEFETTWKDLKETSTRLEYLNLFKKLTYKKVFNETLSVDTINSIIYTLSDSLKLINNSSLFTSKYLSSLIIKVLEGLKEIKGFTLTLQLLSDDVFDNLEKIFKNEEIINENSSKFNEIKKFFL